MFFEQGIKKATKKKMRVISGIAKGRKLQTIEGTHTRPTTDRMKETIFNMIAFDLPNCDFLDLFAGSGAIGIEALSRGAKTAVFVENFADCRAVLASNLAHTKLEEQATIFNDVLQALPKLVEKEKKFDIIFLDPPYEDVEMRDTVLKFIGREGLLKDDGYIILEHATKHPIPPIEGLSVLREKKYKITTVTFLQ